MKKVTSFFMAMLFVVLTGSLFAADPEVVDVTGHDCEWHYYVQNTLGPRIAVSDNGDVHVVYNKSYAGSDTGFVLLYKNLTTAAMDTIRPQEVDPTIPQNSRAFIGGGQGSAPLFIMTGISTYSFRWGSMALSNLSAVEDGKVVAKGIQTDRNYYADAWYGLPSEMVVDANGIAHVIGSNVGGASIFYWNSDGTNFGEIYCMYDVYPNNDVPGKSVPGRLRRNATSGADLAVTNDGMTVAVGGLHAWSNIDVTFGTVGGEIWPDDYEVAAGDGSYIFLFDTTNGSTGENLVDHTKAKPSTDLQLAYDDNNVLHIVYAAAWFSHYLDTLSDASFAARNLDDGTDKWGGWNWMTTYYYLAGDENAVYYGTGHPKPQIRYWNSNMPLMQTSTDAHTKIAETTYPLPGEEYKWFFKGVIDSGVGLWGQRAECILEDVEFVVNHNAADGEPAAVIVYNEMGSPFTDLGHDSTNTGFFGYYKDIMITATSDFATWTNPVNLTNTADVDEGEVSVHGDIIDNKIHMIYNSDDLPMADYFLNWTNMYTDMFQYGPTMRKVQNVNIMYQEVDLAVTSIKDPKAVPGSFALEQNYPNPFNPTTTINYTVPAGDVTMDIYNVLGQKVKTLVNKVHTAGSYTEVWNGTNNAGILVSSGVYVYKLKTKAGVKVKKMLLQK